MRLLLGKFYRPIEGSVVGELLHLDVVTNEVQWAYRDRVFIIPMERFTEYFIEHNAISE